MPPPDRQVTNTSFRYQWFRRARGRGESRSLSFGYDPAQVAQKIIGWLEAAGEPSAGRRLCLDLGCGSAEKALIIARDRPQWRVIGVDRTDGFMPVARTARNGPLLLLRGDVLAAAVKPASVDMIYSIGVFHSTPDPRRAMRESLRLLRPGGTAVVWLYPHPDEDPKWRFYYFQRDLLRGMGFGRLPHPVQYRLLEVVTVVMSLPVYLARRGWGTLRGTWRGSCYDHLPLAEKIRSMAFVLFDNVTPEYQYRPAAAEVTGWLDACGCERVAPLTVPGLFVARKRRPA